MTETKGKNEKIWGSIKGKLDSATTSTIKNIKSSTDKTYNAAKNISIKDVKSVKDRAVHFMKHITVEDNLINIGKNIKDSTINLTRKDNLFKFRAYVTKTTEDTWKYMNETSDVAIEKYKKMDKRHKLLAISAMAGGAVVSLPFIVAVGPISIVSALATLGGGAIAAGGFGVSGGIVVAAGGAALAASIAGVVAHKMIDDPEVTELIDRYSNLEEIIRQNFKTMDNSQDKYKRLYEKYAETANFVTDLQSKIQKGEKYDISEVRNTNDKLKYVIEDLQHELKDENVT